MIPRTMREQHMSYKRQLRREIRKEAYGGSITTSDTLRKGDVNAVIRRLDDSHTVKSNEVLSEVAPNNEELRRKLARLCDFEYTPPSAYDIAQLETILESLREQ